MTIHEAHRRVGGEVTQRIANPRDNHRQAHESKAEIALSLTVKNRRTLHERFVKASNRREVA